MKLMSTLFALLLSIQLLAQFDCPAPTALSRVDGNNISATISNGGDLFWSGTGFGQFNAPADDPNNISTIFASGLWMGGVDPGGNQKIAAQDYGRSSGVTDYSAGPLTNYGQAYYQLCTKFDKIWTVTKDEVETHLADFQDNGVIDNPIASIFAWPGRNSASFEQYNSFQWPSDATASAPFFEIDPNGIYEPELGEYPYHPSFINKYPTQLHWTVFNDAGTLHTSSTGDAVQAEIQLSAWSFECADNEVLRNTIFTSFLITNKSIESLDSFHVGLWTDFDLGCYTDDFMGSAPSKNAYFAYNRDNLDGETSANDCAAGAPTYGENPPAQSVTFLNKSLDNFMFMNNGQITPNPATAEPNVAHEYYNYLTGSWRDGTPLTTGGNGYNLGSTSLTHFAYPDDPNDPNGWSMFSTQAPLGDRRTVASHKVGHLDPGQHTLIDIAFTYHRRDGNTHLENVSQMYTDIDELQGYYDTNFAGVCEDQVLSAPHLIPASAYQLSPNPSTGQFNLELNDLEIDQLKVFDLAGKVGLEQLKVRGTTTLDLSHLPAGMYVLEMRSGNSRALDKLVIIK